MLERGAAARYQETEHDQVKIRSQRNPEISQAGAEQAEHQQAGFTETLRQYPAGISSRVIALLLTARKNPTWA